MTAKPSANSNEMGECLCCFPLNIGFGLLCILSIVFGAVGFIGLKNPIAGTLIIILGFMGLFGVCKKRKKLIALYGMTFIIGNVFAFSKALEEAFFTNEDEIRQKIAIKMQKDLEAITESEIQDEKTGSIVLAILPTIFVIYFGIVIKRYYDYLKIAEKEFKSQSTVEG